MALGFFEFALGVIVIGTISSVVHGGMKIEREKQKTARRELDNGGDQIRGVVGSIHEDVAKLKERVRVLEKLVTDDDRRLADEIERLRRSETNSRV